jgi:hypothetical protein
MQATLSLQSPSSVNSSVGWVVRSESVMSDSLYAVL